ncbi:MAG TPA: hypothetical protein VIS52_09540 [Motiliproteus sp.]
MIKTDLLPVAALALLLTLCALFAIDPLLWLGEFSHRAPLAASFVKFALLATAGELLGARIASGRYPGTEFGLLPKALVWGLLGILIKLAFVVFATGVPVLLGQLGLEQATTLLGGPLNGDKLLLAFAISLALNLIFAPLLMITHKVTDLHIQLHHGRLGSLLRPIDVGQRLAQIDWRAMWSFVFKKTIPLFWIPAHTITFLLPAQYQVLFAAALGVLLGVLLALPARSPAPLAALS